jgi:diacylglycerol kinase (ATP)
VNPRSFHLSHRDRAWQLETLAGRAGIPCLRVQDREPIADALDALIDGGARVIAIAGGDGTIQGALTHLATVPSERTPKLIVLGGGRTNLTPRDFGARGGPVALFQRALRPDAWLQPLRRRVLTLSQPGMAPVSGFFLAGALVDHLVRDCHAYRAAGSGPLRHGAPSTAWFLLRTAAQAMAGAYRYAPPTLAVQAPPLGDLSGPMPLLLCTTLDHSGDLLNPYARRGEGTLRLLAVRSDARAFWQRVPRIVRGRFTEQMNAAAGYLSGRCEHIEIAGLPSVSLDGQELELDSTMPLSIAAGPEFEFLQP